MIQLLSIDCDRMAERGGFEPPVHLKAYDGLANRCFRPLSHLSVKVCGLTERLAHELQ
jgi:hypothetical protein